jgi:hypothetical protein
MRLSSVRLPVPRDWVRNSPLAMTCLRWRGTRIRTRYIPLRFCRLSHPVHHPVYLRVYQEGRLEPIDISKPLTSFGIVARRGSNPSPTSSESAGKNFFARPLTRSRTRTRLRCSGYSRYPSQFQYAAPRKAHLLAFLKSQSHHELL